jgi:hypothetical protein
MNDSHFDNQQFGINDNSIRYWRQTGYKGKDLLELCRRHDESRLVAMIEFQNGEVTRYVISSRCDRIRQGHFPSVLKFFSEVVAHPILAGVNGILVIWLEDGLYEFEYNLAQTVPLFVFGRSIYDSCSLLIPDPAYTESFGYQEELNRQEKFEDSLPFSSRINTIFWRGAASGVNFHDIPGWRNSSRGKIVLGSKALGKPDIFDGRFTKVEGWSKLVTDDILSEDIVSPPIHFYDFLRYRYLVDADGISCAWISLFKKLASRSVVVKMESTTQQWYYDRLKPWQHYVPLNVNMTDVEHLWHWLDERPDECERIVSRAHELIQSLKYEREVEQTARLVREIVALRKD